MASGLDLGKQVGPLPVGGWIVVVGAGLGFGYFINKRNSEPSTEDPSSQQLTETGVGMGGGQLIFDPPQTSTPDTDPETNAAWGRRAINHLIALNYDANAADRAINKYLTGVPRTTSEQALVALVLASFGAPPEAVPISDDQPEEPSPVRTPPAAPSLPRVDRFANRNVVSWVHDGKNVTRFVVNATAVKTGNTTTALVPVWTKPNRYSWDHVGGVGSKGSLTKYEIVPFNVDVRGPSIFISAAFK
jgi:hypothetical protein